MGGISPFTLYFLIGYCGWEIFLEGRRNLLKWVIFFKTIFYFTTTHITKGQFVGGRLVGGKFPVPSAYTTHYLTPAFPSPKLLIIISFISIYICFPKHVITFQLHTKSGVCKNLIIHKNYSGIYTILYTSFPRLVSLFYYFIQLCLI